MRDYSNAVIPLNVLGNGDIPHPTELTFIPDIKKLRFEVERKKGKFIVSFLVTKINDKWAQSSQFNIKEI